MRRLGFIVLVLILLLSLFYVQLFDVPVVEASSVYQGDLVLSGNNVTVIEGRFDINGSIRIEDNATLYLQNAILNFTQNTSSQHDMRLIDPSNGNPRLVAYNTTITTSNLDFRITLFSNSTVEINNCSCPTVRFWAQANSVFSISNNSDVYVTEFFGSPVVNIYDSNVEWLWNRDSCEVQVYGSEIGYFAILNSKSVNCTITELEPTLVSYWNFISNCSVSIQPGGSTPNVTFTDTKVNNWQFAFYGDSNATISNSTLRSLGAADFSVLYIKSTELTYGAWATGSSNVLIVDSHPREVRAISSSNVRLLNSTFNYMNVFSSAEVYVSWYLDVIVEDSVNQVVPSANVTVSYPNSTLVDSKLTDSNGLARFPLMEKMVNETGEYPVGNYTVEAAYDTYLSSTTVNMTGTQQLILTLEDFVIPEFSSVVLVSTLIIATLAVTIVGKNKSKK